MENFILRQKWIGFMAAIIISLFVAVTTSNSLKEAYTTFAPTIAQEIDNFLPITIKNGEIVAPKDALIERSFGSTYGNAGQGGQYKIVLNTQVSDLNIANLSSGIYVTRNKVYSYDAKKGEVKIQSLAQMPDAEITRDDVKEFVLSIEKYLKPTLVLVFFVLISLYIGSAVFVYTILMHWLFKKSYNADFALTLRVNTLSYLTLFCISALTGINFGIIVTILILLACNYLANILLDNKKTA